MSFQGFRSMWDDSSRIKNALGLKTPDQEPQREEGAVIPQAMRFRPNPQEDDQEAADDPTNYLREYKRLYDTPGPATSAYKAHLATMPQQQDYKPSGWTRAAAGLSGISAGMRDAGKGIEVAQGLNQSRYRQALGEYGMKEKNLSTAAKIEDQETENKIKFLRDAETSGLNYKKYLRERDKDVRDETFRNRQQTDVEAKNQWEKEAAFRPKGSDFHYIPQEDGSEIRVGADGTRTKIAGNSAEAARIKIARQQANAATTSAAASTENAQTNRLGMLDTVGYHNRTTDNQAREIRRKENEPPSRVPPQQTDVAQQMALDNMRFDPRWKDFIEPPSVDNNYKPQRKGPEDFPNDRMYQNFLEAYQKKVQEVLGTSARPGQPKGLYDDSEFTPLQRQ